jgi:hypothetical protein
MAKSCRRVMKSCVHTNGMRKGCFRHVDRDSSASIRWVNRLSVTVAVTSPAPPLWSRSKHTGRRERRTNPL